MTIRTTILAGAVALAVAVVGTVGGADALTRGGTLNASTTAEPKSLDPLLGDAPSVDTQVLTQLYDSLVRWTAEGRIEPFLAESYTYADDGKTLTFKLHPGVKFHDGTDLDAEAVAFNIRRLLDGKIASLYTSGVADVASVDVIDPLTVKISLKTPSAVVLAAFAGPAGMVASPAAIQKSGEDFGTRPVGSGPFKLASRQGGTSLSLVRNENYWRKGKDGGTLPYLDGINFRWITQTAVKMIELESGNIDLVDDISSDDFAKVAANPKLVLMNAGGISHWISFNVTKPPFNDERVRKAIYYGIDRAAAAQIVAGEYGRVIPTIVHPDEFVFDDTIDVYRYDPARARALLAEAGYGPGKPLVFDMSMIQRQPDDTIAQIVQAQLEEIGVQVNIKQLERQAFIDEWRNKQHDAGMARVDLPRGDPDATFATFFGRKAPQRTGDGDAMLYDLADKGRMTVDQDARRAVYVEAQKRLLEIASYVWIFMRESKHARSVRVQDMAITPVKTWYLDEAWLAQ